MPRVRLDLKPKTYEALAARAIEERRPIDWQAEVLIEAGLGLRNHRAAPRRNHDTAAGDTQRQESEAAHAVA